MVSQILHLILAKKAKIQPNHNPNHNLNLIEKENTQVPEHK